MEKITVEYIKNQEIDKESLLHICELKQQHWKYELNEQIDWISKNIQDNDIHLLIWKKDKLIAYLNMIEIKVEYNYSLFSMYGIGNVCVDKEHMNKSYGHLLMKIADHYLYSNKKEGLLLCKDELIPFYKKMKWNIFDGKIIINHNSFEHYLFSTCEINSPQISIDRNF